MQGRYSPLRNRIAAAQGHMPGRDAEGRLFRQLITGA